MTCPSATRSRNGRGRWRAASGPAPGRRACRRPRAAAGARRVQSTNPLGRGVARGDAEGEHARRGARAPRPGRRRRTACRRPAQVPSGRHAARPTAAMPASTVLRLIGPMPGSARVPSSSSTPFPLVRRPAGRARYPAGRMRGKAKASATTVPAGPDDEGRCAVTTRSCETPDIRRARTPRPLLA